MYTRSPPFYGIVFYILLYIQLEDGFLGVETFFELFKMRVN